MTITDHIEALDMTLEAADGSDTITLAYATVEELRDTLAWAQDRLERLPQSIDELECERGDYLCQCKKEGA